jgi:hypothetical protein
METEKGSEPGVLTLLRLPRWALNPKHGGTVVWLCLRSGSCKSSGVKKHLHESGQEKKQSKKKGARWRRWRRRGGWGGNHGESFQCKLVDILWRTTTLQVRIRSSRILVRAWPRYSPSSALILGLAVCNCEEEEEKVSHNLQLSARVKYENLKAMGLGASGSMVQQHCRKNCQW